MPIQAIQPLWQPFVLHLVLFFMLTTKASLSSALIDPQTALAHEEGRPVPSVFGARIQRGSFKLRGIPLRAARQQGFAMLALVLLTSIVSLTIVVGYAGVMVRQQALQAGPSNTKFLNEAQRQLERNWALNSDRFYTAGATPETAAQLLNNAGVQLRGGAMAQVSNVFNSPADGLSYQSLVVYFPADTDIDNPPDIASFISTGVFKSCSNTSANCGTRLYFVVSSLDKERLLLKETKARLQRVAQKAQSYFKARTLQDPERNISVNYFRKPLGGCDTLPLQDLGCLDTYTPLASPVSRTSESRITMATNLSLTDEELFSAWGTPLEASNYQDSSWSSPPFSLVIRAKRPDGTYLYIHAVQQI